MTPPIDIIIPIRLTREFASADECFYRCIEGLRAHTQNYKVVFVDDNSDAVGQALVENVAADFPSSILIRTHKQRWFSRAVNLGLRLVNTEWVVVLNSDAIPQAGWLEELLSLTTLGDHIHRVGLVGSVHSPNDPRRYIITNEPGYVTGHCWLLRMEAMRQVENKRNTPGKILDELDPLAIHIRSDVYLCYDLNRLGWLTVVSHHSHVDHNAGKSWGHQLHRIPNNVYVVNDSY